jgi:hypothetical protein
MDLLNSELGSSDETCVTSALDGNEVTSTEAESVSDISEEAAQETTTIPATKTEPKVSFVCGGCYTISCWLYPELPDFISVISL